MFGSQSFLGRVDARRVFLWTFISALHFVHFTAATVESYVENEIFVVRNVE